MAYTLSDTNGKILLRAEGKTAPDAFVQGARGFFSLLYDADHVRGEERVKIALDGKDLATLFVLWLQDLSERAELSGLALGEFRVASIQQVNANQYVLTGEAFGEPYDATRHGEKKKAPALKKKSATVSGDRVIIECSAER